MGYYSFLELDFGQNNFFQKNFYENIALRFSDILRAFPRFKVKDHETGSEPQKTETIYNMLKEKAETANTIEDIIDLAIECSESYDAFYEACPAMRNSVDSGRLDVLLLGDPHEKMRVLREKFISELREWLKLRYLFKKKNEIKTKKLKDILHSVELDNEYDTGVGFVKMRSNCGARIADKIKELGTEGDDNPIQKEGTEGDDKPIQKEYYDFRMHYFKLFGGMMSGSEDGKRQREPSVRFRSKYDIPLAALFFGNKLMWERTMDEVCLFEKKYIRPVDVRNLLRNDLVKNYIDPFIGNDKNDDGANANAEDIDKAVISYLIERVTLRKYIAAVEERLTGRYKELGRIFDKNIGPLLDYWSDFKEKPNGAILIINFERKPWMLGVYLLAIHPLTAFRTELIRTCDFFRIDGQNYDCNESYLGVSYGTLCGILAHQIFLYFPLVTAMFDYFSLLRKDIVQEADEINPELHILSGQYDSFDDDIEDSKHRTGSGEIAQDVSVNFFRLLDMLCTEKSSYLIDLMATDFGQNDKMPFSDVWQLINQKFEAFKDWYGIALNDNRPIIMSEK